MNSIIAFTIVRAALGLNILLHGWVRIKAGRENFAGALQIEFADTIIPGKAVKAFALYLPFAEFIIGLLLFVGLLTQVAIIAGSVVMMMLLFGKSLKADWQTVTFQMIYTAFYAVLEAMTGFNKISLDTILS